MAAARGAGGHGGVRTGMAQYAAARGERAVAEWCEAWRERCRVWREWSVIAWVGFCGRGKGAWD
ncbi:hypothetical protein LC55x_1979 [Lysobacter capsici]|nr:hypothetical protein LC55x_1979 [Lysobacter capsici]